MNLQENLRNLRQENKITQEQIAVNLKISQRTYSNYETGRTEPDLKTLTKIADFYKISTDYLLGRYKKGD